MIDWVDSEFEFIEFGVALFTKGDQIPEVVDRHESKIFQYLQPFLLSDTTVDANLINVTGLHAKPIASNIPTTQATIFVPNFAILGSS